MHSTTASRLTSAIPKPTRRPSALDFFGKTFVPTTGDQKEFGVKYLPPGLELLMTGAVFDITQYNVLTPDLAHPGRAVQTSSVQSRGAEFELKTTHLYGFNISAAYTYLDAKVISSNTAGVTGKHPIAFRCIRRRGGRRIALPAAGLTGSQSVAASAMLANRPAMR